MIFIKNLKKITDEKYAIGYKHYQPFHEKHGLRKTEEQLLQEGKLIEKPGDLDVGEGEEQKLFYNPVTNEGFYELIEVGKDDIELLREDLNNAILELSMMIGGM